MPLAPMPHAQCPTVNCSLLTAHCLKHIDENERRRKNPSTEAHKFRVSKIPQAHLSFISSKSGAILGNIKKLTFLQKQILKITFSINPVEKLLC